VIHDVALQNLPVIFCLDRAGLVGEDGATHHGVFDITYLRCIPNLIIFAPRNEIELRNILYTAQLGLEQPIAIRYPRGYGKVKDWQQSFSKIEIGKAITLKQGDEIAILSIGTISDNVNQAIDLAQNKKSLAHFDMRFVKPLDEELLNHIFSNFSKIITVEDGTITGGFGSSIVEYAAKKNFKNDIQIVGVPDDFITHGSILELQKEVGLDSNSLAKLFSKT
jgi:1-deoxy-D-xylulose-5-phosphate synthase